MLFSWFKENLHGLGQKEQTNLASSPSRGKGYAIAIHRSLKQKLMNETVDCAGKRAGVVAWELLHSADIGDVLTAQLLVWERDGIVNNQRQSAWFKELRRAISR